MHRRKLPIGIQTFAKIREADYYYVDKTGFIRQMIDQGGQYFLSRPRRFGKSLLLDTLAELFAGNEPLFRGTGDSSRLGLDGALSNHPLQLWRGDCEKSGGTGPTDSRPSAP